MNPLEITAWLRPASVRASGWLGAALAVMSMAAVWPGLNEVGVTWDEPRYFQSVERIQSWTARLASGDVAGALDREAIREAWDSDRYYNPHPPAYKEGMALTDALFRRWLPRPGSFRLSSLFAFGLLVGLVAWCTARVAGVAAGATAGCALLLMPRVFGHAHVAATDMPLTLLWFAATLGVFFHVRDGRRRWILLAGVALGLGMATKFTAWLMPVPLAGWMLLAARERRAWLAGLFGIALALAVAVIANPAAWPDPLGFQVRLVGESLSRDSYVPISTYYAGQIYPYVVPWHEAIVMTFVTLPIGTLVLAGGGVASAIRRGPARSLAILCLIEVAFWWALLALPSSPNHDGVRLWLPMFPFVAVLAGLGFARLAELAARRVRSGSAAPLVALLGLLFFVPAGLATRQSSPYYLSYYGELIGGPAGAARRGMEATYWFDAVSASFRERLEAALPTDARVVAYPNSEYYQLLQGMGLLRTDLRFTDAPPADYLVLLGRKAMLERGWETVYQQARPLLAVELDGVELVGLYAWSDSTNEAGDTAEGEAP
ncbi:MAG: glycosyltransferase family 39 protein [Gemmatimonadales bacterium]|jgi:hypothetical protein